MKITVAAKTLQQTTATPPNEAEVRIRAFLDAVHKVSPPIAQFLTPERDADFERLARVSKNIDYTYMDGVKFMSLSDEIKGGLSVRFVVRLEMLEADDVELIWRVVSAEKNDSELAVALVKAIRADMSDLRAAAKLFRPFL